MVQSSILYEQLTEYDSQSDIERTLVRLIHAAFEDDNFSISFSKPPEVYFETEWVDAGGFSVEDYTVEKKDEDSFKIHLSASYEEMAPDDHNDADFHSVLRCDVVLKLRVQCSARALAGGAEVYVVPKV